MKDDIIFPHEVEVASLPILPPVAPGIGSTYIFCPLDTCREVANHGVKPDVDLLIVTLGILGERNRHTPFEVAGDRPWLEILDEVEGEATHIGAPVLLLLDPGLEALGKDWQIEEEVLSFAEDGGMTINFRAWIDQIHGIELVAAVVTLITTGLGVTTDRTGALDVPIG